jgi:hypothetical protein
MQPTICFKQKRCLTNRVMDEGEINEVGNPADVFGMLSRTFASLLL